MCVAENLEKQNYFPIKGRCKTILHRILNTIGVGTINQQHKVYANQRFELCLHDYLVYAKKCTQLKYVTAAELSNTQHTQQTQKLTSTAATNE